MTHMYALRPPYRPSSMMWVTPAARAAVMAASIFVGRMSLKRHFSPRRHVQVGLTCSGLQVIISAGIRTAGSESTGGSVKRKSGVHTSG